MLRIPLPEYADGPLALPGRFNANYARRTTAPRRDGLRPRGCWLVLLRSVTSTASFFTAKTQREARLNPSETDLPRFCEACAMPGGLPRSIAGLTPIMNDE